MAINYSWSVNTLKKKNLEGQQDVVVQAYWTKTGTDENGLTGTFSGVTSFTLTPGSDFITYEDLDEITVLGWIQTKLETDPVISEEKINIQIQQQIDDKKGLVTKMPWELPTVTS